MTISRGLLLVLFLWAGSAFAQPTPSVYTGKYTQQRQPWAVVRTDRGNVLIRLLEAKVPRTVAHFIGLARGTTRWKHPSTGKWSNKPFYTGLRFHRVLKGYLVQAGCPENKGTSGPGFRVKQEWSPLLRHNRIGTVSMVTMKDGLIGSQFFVTVRPMPWLDYRSRRSRSCDNFTSMVPCVRDRDCQTYADSFPGLSKKIGRCRERRLSRGTTLFGVVVKGMEVIRAIERNNVTSSGAPISPTTILNVDIYRARRWKPGWIRRSRPVRPDETMFHKKSR